MLGHLHLLGGKQILARTLGTMADSYGPAFTLWIGQRRTVVVSSWEVAKECLTVHDKALATRPLLAAGKFLAYNYAMFGLAPYGPYWREARKLATLQLLSGRQLELMKHIRAMEVSLSVRRLHHLWEKNHRRPVKVEFKQWLADLAFNNVAMMVAGKRYYGEDADADDEAGEYKAAVDSLFYLMGVLVPSDAIPCLEWLDIGGYIRAMKETERKLDSLATGWIEEHRRRRTTTGVTAGQDLIDVMLSMIYFSEFLTLEMQISDTL